MEYGFIFITMACLFGFFMAWGVGANDVANAMGTSVGSRAITVKQAIIIAIIFEAAGALFAGGQVTNTIRGKIIDASMLSGSPELLVYGMLAALLAAGTWLLIASYYSWPVSTTHSIIGAVIGFAIVALGMDTVHWDAVGNIVLSWIVTPVLSGVIAYFLFQSVQRLIFNSVNPFRSAKRYVPGYIFLVSVVICLVTLKKGLKHVGLPLTDLESIVYSVLLSLVFTALGILLLRKIKANKYEERDSHFATVEKVFAVLMVFTACAMAFAHGSNDVANAIGPLAAVVSIVQQGGEVAAQAPLPVWILFLGAIGIVLGLTTYGYRVMATIGSSITELTPSRGFAAQLACASTVVIASGMGLPISTTQTLVGAVLGVGFARGIGALNLSVVRNIFMSWVITLPAGAIFAIIYFYIFRAIFS